MFRELFDSTSTKLLGQTITYLILTFVVSASLFLVVTRVSLIKEIDAAVYHLISLKWRSPLLTLLFAPFGLWFFPPPWRRFFFQPAFFYFLLFPAGFYLFWRERREFWWWLLTLLLGTSLSGLVLSMHWHWLRRPRPFTHLSSPVTPAIQKVLAKWPSFPSGHTRDTALYGTIIASFIPDWRWLVIILTGIVAYARIYSGEHYPTDVLGGILVGFLAGKTVVYGVNWLRLVTATLVKIYGH